jgi:transcriptional regulatory protein RtcR
LTRRSRERPRSAHPITVPQVEAEVARLRTSFAAEVEDGGLGSSDKKLDEFDRVQLAAVVGVCKESKLMSEAGRRLFAQSRLDKKSSNDADRLRKCLARFDLTFEALR